MINALLIHHYKRGAWYPRGGSSEIAFHMIPVIERAGGRVLVRASVSRILLTNGRATGEWNGKAQKIGSWWESIFVTVANVTFLKWTFQHLYNFALKHS